MTRVASTLLGTFLNPLAANNVPGAPAATPALWSLVAFARREFDTAFVSPSLTAAPFNVQTTGQAVAAEQRTLVLTAFPAEADAILARTTLDSNPSVVVDGRHFYLGSIGGKKVIVAMTGIGMVNAAHTTETSTRPLHARVRHLHWRSGFLGRRRGLRTHRDRFCGRTGPMDIRRRRNVACGR